MLVSHLHSTPKFEISHSCRKGSLTLWFNYVAKFRGTSEDYKRPDSLLSLSSMTFGISSVMPLLLTVRPGQCLRDETAEWPTSFTVLPGEVLVDWYTVAFGISVGFKNYVYFKYWNSKKYRALHWSYV